jgi:glycosyltransferase involved in cell wall biosynthesis
VPARSSVGDLLALKQGLGIPQGRSVVGSVGRLQPGKGQERFIRAIAALQQRGRDIHGLIVGGNAHNLSPGYVERLEQLANTLGVSGRITFTGQVDAAGPYIQLMDVLVSASRSESFGIVLLEAMALGVPVASFDAGGPAEIVQDGRSGVLVPAGDDPSLVEALDRLVLDLFLRRRLAAAGLERFHTFFSAESMSRRMEQCLCELCPN